MAPIRINDDIADGSAIGNDSKAHGGADDTRIAIHGGLWDTERKRTADCEHHLRTRSLVAGYRQNVIKRCTRGSSAGTEGTAWTEILKEEGGRCRGHNEKGAGADLAEISERHAIAGEVVGQTGKAGGLTRGHRDDVRLKDITHQGLYPAERIRRYCADDTLGFGRKGAVLVVKEQEPLIEGRAGVQGSPLCALVAPKHGNECCQRNHQSNTRGNRSHESSPLSPAFDDHFI